MFDIFKPGCPKCGSKNLGIVKESLAQQMRRFTRNVLIPIMFLFSRAPKPLYVCKDCGFSWEKR